jgi:hypothetical protein
MRWNISVWDHTNKSSRGTKQKQQFLWVPNRRILICNREFVCEIHSEASRCGSQSQEPEVKQEPRLSQVRPIARSDMWDNFWQGVNSNAFG